MRTSRAGSFDRLERIGFGALVAAVGGGVFLWRVLSWPSAQSPDAWAYLTWGGSLLHGDEPAYGLTSTAPKPLGTLLGALLWPLPPERAFAVLAAVSLGILFGALFVAAQRRAGTAAGLVSVAVLLPLVRAGNVIAYGYIDALIAALVALAFAVRGAGKIAALVVAGLARPEAWLIAGVAGFTETEGRLPRRVLAAVACAAVAPLLWIGFDFALTGDALFSSHRSSDLQETRGREPSSWSDVVSDLADRLPGGPALAAAGLAVGLLGLVLPARGRWRRDRDVLLPLAALVIWLVALVIETRRGLRINHRYLLPVFVPLALGAGLLVSRFLPARLANGKVYAAVGAALVAAWTVTLDLGPEPTRWASHVRGMLATAPTVERVLPCTRVAVVGQETASAAILAELAAASRRSPRDYALLQTDRRPEAVLRIQRSLFRPPPGWERRETPLGLLAVAPACAGRLGR